MDEMYVRIKGQWIYLYRAVDKAGHTVEFLLTSTRDRAAAMAFLHQAIRQHGCPETITIDQTGSNTAAIQQYNRVHHTGIAIRQCKYLNNLVEQDHRAVKRKVRSMLGFKSSEAAQCTLAGIERYARDSKKATASQRGWRLTHQQYSSTPWQRDKL